MGQMPMMENMTGALDENFAHLTTPSYDLLQVERVEFIVAIEEEDWSCCGCFFWLNHSGDIGSHVLIHPSLT